MKLFIGFVLFVALTAISCNQKKEKEIFLYPGYLVKDDGRLIWCSKKPVFKEIGWDCSSCVDVTGCINDPWPYSSGGKDFCTIIGEYK